MKEFTTGRHSRGERATAGVLVTLIASFAIAACGGSPAHAKAPHGRGQRHIAERTVPNTPPLQPCFDKPVPQAKPPKAPGNPPSDISSPDFIAQENRWQAEENKYEAANFPPEMHLKPDQGLPDYIQGDPIFPSDSLEQRVESANVQISTNSGKGSGVVVDGPHHQRLIVTAAHVVMGAKGPITITDNSESKTTVASGCYVYQEGGKEQSVKQEESSDTQELGTIDYAILVPKRHIGGTALKLASSLPHRGDWAEFVNSQMVGAGADAGAGDPGTPSAYYGLVVEEADSPTGLVALTGIDAGTNKPGNWENYTLTPGGSGGMVVEGSTVEAISDNSEVKQLDLENGTVDSDSWGDVNAEFNVSPGPVIRENRAMSPSVTGLTPAKYILYGLQNGHYGPSSFALAP
jgi:hypothetical protein